jgi:nicotinate dehydrogenase subunit B
VGRVADPAVERRHLGADAAQDAAGLTTNSVRASAGDVGAGLAGAAKTMSATYRVSYQTHGPIGPNCAIADVRSGAATVLCSTQDIYTTQTRLTLLLGMTPDQISVTYWESASRSRRSRAI